MAKKLVGCFWSEFPSQDDKSVMVHGYKIHVIETEIFNDPGMTRGKGVGQMVESHFIHESKPAFMVAPKIPIGSIITPVYNSRGKIEDLVYKSPEELKK